jgi:hypothetical protein
VKQRAKLTAGRNWTAFLGGQRSRPDSTARTPLARLEGKELLKVTEKRIKFLLEAMKTGDRDRARVALNETMYLLRRSRDLPGDEQRRMP